MNVVFVTLDALRRDKLGCYGHKGNLTPAIDSIAKKSIVFDNAVTVSNTTDPSHASFLTGTYPNVHGVKENGWKLKKDTPRLAVELKKSGRLTAAAVSVEHLSSFFGWDLGFDYYFNNNRFDKVYHFFSRFDFKIGKYRFFSFLSLLRKIGFLKNTHFRSSSETNRVVLPWIERNSCKDFFLWVHYFDCHKPYKPDYDSGVRLVDNAVGDLVEKLKETSVLEKTILVLTSDHGETFKEEHGYEEHGHSLYEPEIRIPLIVYCPKKLGRGRIKQQVRSIDLMPTILEMLSLKVPTACQGKSLLPALNGKSLMLDAFIESYPVYRDSKCIRTHDGWKYIFNADKEDELFNLLNDPFEKNNLIKKEKALAKKLKKRLFEWIESGERIESQQIDSFTSSTLKGLGYL